MKVLFASVEMSPLAKVGGLADVAGSLPRALRARSLDVRVALPLHGGIDISGFERVAQRVRVPWPGGDETIDVVSAESRGVPVMLVRSKRFFGRPEVYGYEDDSERFLFFCDALIAAAPRLGLAPDLIHAQDWHTGLLFTRLAQHVSHRWADAGRLFTIHNLPMQGAFSARWARGHGIGAGVLRTPPGVKPAVGRTAMAQGILHADRINTVSSTYAREIMTARYGAGLDALLRSRRQSVSGIVNGIDYEEFNPRTDRHIAANYDARTIEKRSANKRALQQEAGLPVDDDVPLFGAVTRLFHQKGMDLVARAFDRLLAERPAQLALLGTGDEAVHAQLRALQARFPRNVKLWLAFDPPLGQRIYAGCDVFLMPSRYEPCGLGQLISLRYGAVPLVRRTGGLADTVQDAGPSSRQGTGFVFDRANAPALRQACERAADLYADRAAWRAVQRRGMEQDWSWERASAQYQELYAETLTSRREAAAS